MPVTLTSLLADLEPYAASPATYGFVVLLGLLWGSFANVCIYRMPPTEEHPNGRSVVAPGSHCFTCKTPVRWYDNVPLLSYVWLRGKCRQCKAEFSPRYLFVEALTGILFGCAWWFMVVAVAPYEAFDVRLLRFVIACGFVFTMVVVAFIDADHKLILNKVTIPAMVVFYAASLLLPGHTWYDGLIGAAVGYGIPLAIGGLYFLIRKVEGLGLGDGMLLAVIGTLEGWRGVIVGMFGGATLGVLIVIPVLVARRLTAPKDSDQPSLMMVELPFGVFIAMAAVIYLFAEPWVHLDFRPLV
jgi:leader peptidase (prepilin peptidase)/N-methyltransferase